MGIMKEKTLERDTFTCAHILVFYLNVFLFVIVVIVFRFYGFVLLL